MTAPKFNKYLRIGFATIYAWRPHVEQTWYLAHLAKQAGHEIKFLTCDGDLSSCYSKLLHGGERLRECLQCRAGGIRSYSKDGVASIGQFKFQNNAQASPEQTHLWAQSSASTLGRFESKKDYESERFKKIIDQLQPNIATTYTAAREWMIREKINAVCVFNGRIDMTRAIFEAARSLELPVVSHERSWFGNGIQLLPHENCLGLQSIWKITSEWRDKPLTKRQALLSASLVAQRFMRKNTTEWRAYNLNAIEGQWPIRDARYRFLILPSSMNEVFGHTDYLSEWENTLDAFDSIINYLELSPSDIVLRCHPNWSEKIGKQDGSLPEAYYSNWALKRRIHCIPASSRISTMHLIEQCDVVVLAQGSAALEAGALGKQIITVSPSKYHLSGFTINVHGRNQLSKLEELKVLLKKNLPGDRLSSSSEISRYTLRFAYAMAWRIPQFIDSVRVRQNTRFAYFNGADLKRFTRLFTHQVLEPDDTTFDSAGESGENEVFHILNAKRWEKLIRFSEQETDGERIKIQRRGAYRIVDILRRVGKVGDR